jgi:hypothetical protein
MNFMDYLVDETKETQILPEAAIARLREVAKLYSEPMKFEVGDLVMPRKDGFKKGQGKPHLVIAVNENAHPDFGGDAGSPSYGSVPEVRVLCFMHDSIAPYWIERGELVPHVGDGA